MTVVCFPNPILRQLKDVHWHSSTQSIKCVVITIILLVNITFFSEYVLFSKVRMFVIHNVGL